MDLANKIAIVTGSSGGIGKEITRLFTSAGANVIGIDISESKSNDNINEFVKLNITDTMECEEKLNYVLTKYKKVDILVNCAGITRDSLTKNMTEKQFDDVIDVNLKGAWNLTRIIGPSMQKNHSGSIINISSIVGRCGNIGQVNYAASKAGIVAMTRTWAKEFALKNGNVRVNAISPGYTLTDMLMSVPEKLLKKFSEQTMLGRLANPIEIANVALFLASDLASYITGATINVDGGMIL